MTVELAERMEWGAVKRVALLAIKQAAVDARRQSAAGIMAFDWLKSTGLEWAELVGFNLTAEKRIPERLGQTTKHRFRGNAPGAAVLARPAA
jgi:hypothetical protein